MMKFNYIIASDPLRDVNTPTIPNWKMVPMGNHRQRSLKSMLTKFTIQPSI
ncbi:hypothetical protein CLV57_0029 [Mucilaginibacter auburnensis]|uniref:Uncharacterized protein n=1 Tax=Mucilaginibacter auburnensis TaxID=1457233 RepID=A0A2H9VQH0_9SPHI|nr:hypothetical protein CLV57_0029 [Mucilaginibacter auburnensis]